MFPASRKNIMNAMMPPRTYGNAWAAQLVIFAYVVNSVSPIERSSLELSAGRMIRTVDRRVAGNAAASVSLCCRAQASERQLAIHSGYVAVWQICTAVQVFPVIAGVTALAEHRHPSLQKRRHIRTVRRVAIGAIVHNRRMLPKEGTALFCVARVTRLIDRFLHEELRAG